MRKQLKIAAVVSTAALLALGASMTSMAAAKNGTWKLDDIDWQCFDRNGDVITDEFCMSNGKEYYVGEDGYLVRSSWVDYDDETYYVNSAGMKVTNDWKFVYPMDSEDEEEWFYFLPSGKLVTDNSKKINGKTYYFDEDGIMVTGWVNYNSTDKVTADDAFTPGETYYCDETGARVENSWLHEVEPDADDDDYDQHWYYLDAKGKVSTGKKDGIKGHTYFFDNANGQMITGWVKENKTTGVCAKIENEALSTVIAANKVYYASEDGHMKKDDWKFLWSAMEEDAEDVDADKNWYHFDSHGEVFIPTGAATLSNTKKVKFNDEKLVKNNETQINLTKDKIGKKEYYFNPDGEMVSGFYMDATDLYYINDGVLAKEDFDIKDDYDNVHEFLFDKETGKAKNGVVDGKLYIKGRLVSTGDDKYALASYGGKVFFVDYKGKIQTTTKPGKEYKDGSEVVFKNDTASIGGFDTDGSLLKANKNNFTSVSDVQGLPCVSSYLKEANYAGTAALVYNAPVVTP